MAIDTAAKRKSAIASRRLVWQRRFQPIPDGSMTVADRMQSTRLYAGIEAGAVADDATINICLTVEICTALEFTADIRTALAFDAPICTGLEFTANVGGMC